MAANRKIALIDLNTRQTEIEPIPDEWRRKYIGGRGLGTYLACRHAAVACDPLAPENPIVISAGLLAGTLSSSSAVTAITTLSPLTGFLECALLPGLFAAEMRWAGFDHLVITGRARRWVSLFIHNGTLQIVNAGGLKGCGMTEAGQRLRQALGDADVKTLAIGPAGENRVRFATVADDAGHAAGRTGLGAVFGSKMIKALACRGPLDIEVKFPEQAIAYRQAPPAVQPSTVRRQPDTMPLRDLVHPNGCHQPEPRTRHRLADIGMDVQMLMYTARWAAGVVAGDPERNAEALAELIVRRKGPGKYLAEGPVRAAAQPGFGELSEAFPARCLIDLYREETPVGEAALSVPSFSASPGSSGYYRGNPGTLGHQELSYRLLDCLGDRTCAGICPATGRLDLERVTELIRLNTGAEVKTRALQAAAYRCYALERLSNLRAERAARHAGRLALVLDVPGEVELSPAVWEGIDLETFKRTVAQHYRQNGWDRKALVKKKVFELLGMAELWNLYK